MSKVIKAFSILKELEPIEQIKYEGFENLNNFLEKNSKISIDEIRASYIRVLTGEIDMLSELDMQIKYIIDEVKSPVNRILSFTDEKYKDIHRYVTDNIRKTLKFIGYDKASELVDILTELKNGFLIIECLIFQTKSKKVFTMKFSEEDDFRGFIEKLKSIDINSITNSGLVNISIKVAKSSH